MSGKKTEAIPDPIPPVPAIQACFHFIVWLIRKLDKFPRARRHTLGSRMETLGIEVMERLTMAAFSKPPDKSRHLESANVKLDCLRQLWLLARELQVVGGDLYLEGARLMVGIGNQIGAWRRSSGQGRGAV